MSANKEQFEKEAAALVQIIRDMIGAGQLAEAGQLLGQYALLNPADPDLSELKKAVNQYTEINFPEHLSFLNNVESIFILQALPSKKAGLPVSVFGKLMLLEEKLGYCSTILTVKHDINMRKKEVWFKTFTGSQKVLSPGVKIINAYEYFQKSYSEGLPNIAVYDKPDDNGLFSVKKEPDEFEYGIYKGEILIRKDIYTGYGSSLRCRQYFTEDRLEREEFFDDWGYLNNIVEYDPDNHDMYTIRYYTTDGRICIKTLGKTVNEQRHTIEMTVYNEDGSVITDRCNEAMLTALFLSQITDNSRFNLLVFEDMSWSLITAHLDLDGLNGATIAVMHLPAVENVYDPNSVPKYEYTYFCDNISKFDGIVFLTQGAKNDFITKFGDIKYGDRSEKFVIPHPYYQNITQTDFEKRDKRKAVILSRLAPQKQLDTAVEIFSIVVKALPDARLEIYGAGGAHDIDLQNIKDRINELGMEENVLIMPYVDDVNAIYSTAVMFIMTSKFEGYGLTLMESICNGCPAFSFDIKYGPSDIISNGETGFLFPRDDKEGFAAKIIEYFQDVDMQRKMSGNCYNDTARFSTDRFLERWIGMAEILYNKHLKS